MKRTSGVKGVSLIALALLMTFGASGCVGWEISKTPPTGPEVGADGGASLSPAGVERIQKTGRADFDWSDGHLRLEDVGVSHPGKFAESVSALNRERPLAVTVTAPNATVSVAAERILPYVESGSDEVSELWLSIRADSDAQLASLVREYTAVAGGADDGTEAWLESFESDPQATCSTLGYNTAGGTATGLLIWLEMSCDWEPEPRRFVSVHFSSL